MNAADPSPPASVLSDGTILRLVREGRITIDPWDAAMVQPASVDLRLGDWFRVFHNYRSRRSTCASKPRASPEQVTPPAGEPFVIHPGRVLPGTNARARRAADDIVARIEGKSSSAGSD